MSADLLSPAAGVTWQVEPLHQDIPPQLRDSSSSNLLRTSKAANETTRRVSESTDSKAQELVEETEERLPNDNKGVGRVDDLPSAMEFSAGLQEAGSRSLSQERERSVLGVTSTIRNDDDEGGDSPPVLLKV